VARQVALAVRRLPAAALALALELRQGHAAGVALALARLGGAGALAPLGAGHAHLGREVQAGEGLAQRRVRLRG